MNTEKIKHHIAALREKHRTLDTQIELIETAGHITPLVEVDLHHFKKQRLELKDEIAMNEAKVRDIING